MKRLSKYGKLRVTLWETRPDGIVLTSIAKGRMFNSEKQQYHYLRVGDSLDFQVNMDIDIDWAEK